MLFALEEPEVVGCVVPERRIVRLDVQGDVCALAGDVLGGDLEEGLQPLAGDGRVSPQAGILPVHDHADAAGLLGVESGHDPQGASRFRGDVECDPSGQQSPSVDDLRVGRDAVGELVDLGGGAR